MSLEKIQFKSDELISFFIISDPPDNHDDFLPVFCPECQPPLDQSLYTNNWRPKQQYHRQNNRYQIPLASSSSAALGSTNISEDNQPPIQNTSSTPLNIFSPLSQTSPKSKNSDPSESQLQTSPVTGFQPATLPISNFQPTTFHPATSPVTSFQPNSFQPNTNFQSATPPNANFQPITQPNAIFQPVISQNAGFQPIISPNTNIQPTTFPSTNLPISNFQPATFPSTNLSVSNFQPTTFPSSNLQTSNFQPTAFPPNTTNFQPNVYQHASFQPQNSQMTSFQPSTFQPAYSQATSFQPQSSQYLPPQEMQQPNLGYNLTLPNYQYSPQAVSEATSMQPQQVVYQSPQTSVQNQNNQNEYDIQEEEEDKIENEKQQQEKETEALRQEEREQDQQHSYTNFIYYNNDSNTAQDESFQSVIDTQKDEAAEEEARQREIQAQKQFQHEQQIVPESWTNHNTSGTHENPPSMNAIIADQEFASVIEAQNDQELKTQQLTQKKKNQISTWADANNRQNSSPFEDIIAREEKTLQSNSSPKQAISKFSKSNTKGKTVKMSFQELQRELNKPSGWGEQVMNPVVPSASEIIASVSSESSSKPLSSSSSTTTDVSTGKGKKGKKGKKEVYDIQVFNRMNEEQDKAKKEPAWANPSANQKKSFSTISTEAIYESEKNRASMPPPTTAPVTKRGNHRGRGKEVLGVIKQTAPQKFRDSDDDDDDDYYPPPRQPSLKPSFNAISNAEMAKKAPQNQNKNNQPPPQAATTTNTTSQSKKKKPKYQVISDTNQTPSTSAWDKVSGSKAETHPNTNQKIAFDQLEQSEKVNQPNKPQQQTPNINTAASNVSAVQSKKKKKAKKVYIDNYLYNNQGSGAPFASRYDSSSSDDEDYSSRPRPIGKKNTQDFDALLQLESKNKKEKKKASNLASFSISTKTPIKTQTTNFDALYQQEVSKNTSKSPQSSQKPNKPNNGRGFDALLNNEAALEEANVVQIIDDLDFTKKKQQMPNRSASNPTGNKKGYSNYQKKQQDDNSELFWGRTSKDDPAPGYNDNGNDYDDDEEDYYQQGFGKKKKIERDPKAVFLQNLIEKKLKTKGEEWYEYAQGIMNFDRNKLTRALIAIDIEESDARSIVAAFFKQFSK